MWFLNPWCIGPGLARWLRVNLPRGSTILELGSGAGTAWLTRQWTVVSVEHDPRFLRRHGSRYIYAPIRDGWYDTEVLARELPRRYDLLLVDGPPKRIGRRPLLDHLHLFRSDTWIIVDDVNRVREHALAAAVAARVGRPLSIRRSSLLRRFSVIAPASDAGTPAGPPARAIVDALGLEP